MESDVIYNLMLNAVHSGNVVEAREYARILMKWIAIHAYAPADIANAVAIRDIARALYPNARD